MSDETKTLETIYERFNARDVDGVVAHMHPDVDWPNAWKGGRIRGVAGVRDYWRRQWAEIDPTVTPQQIFALDDGRVAVVVRQVVHDRSGTLLADQIVRHVYRFEGGKVRSMEVGDNAASNPD